MQQVSERPAPAPKMGLFRRLLLGQDSKTAWTPDPAVPMDGGGETTSTTSPNRRDTDLIDLRGPSVAEAPSTAARIDRLEQGVQLMAETLRRACTRLAGSIEELRLQVAVGANPSEVERIVARWLDPLRSAVDDLSRSVERIPFALAPSAGRVTGGVEAHTDLHLAIRPRSPRVGRGIPNGQGVATAAPGPPRPAVPFELEPVEEEFDSLTALRRARLTEADAQSIWGSDASSA